MEHGEKVVLRFSKAQRISHWMFAISFLILAFTGMLLMFSRLGVLADLALLAQGGYSRWIHRIAAAVFILAPVVYFITDRKGLKELATDSFTYDKDDLEWLMPRNMVKNYLIGKAMNMPPQGRINAGEKFHHAIIIMVYFLLVATGLLLLLAKPYMGTLSFSIVVMLHDIGMVGGMVLTAGHIYFTFVYGILSAMTKGWVPESFAKMEHIKWYNKVKATNLKNIDEV